VSESEFWSGKRVFVSGAGGFIGSHLVEALSVRGASVKAYVKYNSRGHRGWLESMSVATTPNVEVILGDVRDYHRLRSAIEGSHVVFHLAALIGIPYSYAAASSYVETNVSGTLNLLQACLEHDVERVVHTSTSEVYGTALYTPIDEQHPLQGQSPYSASKIAADKLAESFHLSFDLPLTTVRPFNCFGPRQSARAVIPTIITQAFVRDRVRLGDLDPIRDLTFVEDTVRAFLCAAASDSTIGEVLNVGTGNGCSIGELAQRILDMMGMKIPVEQVDKRKRPSKSEVMELVCDSGKLAELTGWVPQHSLEQGLTKTIEWVKEHLDVYRPEIYSI